MSREKLKTKSTPQLESEFIKLQLVFKILSIVMTAVTLILLYIVLVSKDHELRKVILPVFLFVDAVFLFTVIIRSRYKEELQSRQES